MKILLSILLAFMQAISHSVTLTWQPSTTPSVTYNLYRSATSGGPYTLQQTGIAPTTTTDLNVVAGQTWFYVVTAEDASNNESVFSNEASSLVPSDQPPFAVVIVICPTPPVNTTLNQSIVLNPDLSVTGTGQCTVHVQK